VSLDISIIANIKSEVYSANITHNLGEMAEAAGLYKAMWRPDEIGVTEAAQLIPILEDGLAKLEAEPGRFRAMNPPNGWGTYEGLLRCARDYLEACKKHPNGVIEVDR
jgi:hypothetical protein